MQNKKEQTATGFLAAILIGVIIGSTAAYPLNQSANKKLADAQGIALEQLEILNEEVKWYHIAKDGLMKETDGLGELILPIMNRLDIESKRDPSKNLLLQNTMCQSGAAMRIAQAYRSEVHEILLEANNHKK